MNNAIKFSYIYFPHSRDLLLINVLGKLIFKLIFYCRCRSLANRSKLNVDFQFVKENFIETILENDSLLFNASDNIIQEFHQYVNKCDEKDIPMKSHWNIMCSFIFDFFNHDSTIRGYSVEKSVFIRQNQPIKMETTSKTVSRAVVFIRSNLVNKFFKLLFCPEILDLIVEKNLLNKLNSCIVENPDNSNNLKSQRNDLKAQDSNDKTESITSFTIISSGKVTLTGNRIELNLSSSTNTETPEWKISHYECKAAGDINRIQASSNFDDERFTEISRISKAKNWIKSNQNTTETPLLELIQPKDPVHTLKTRKQKHKHLQSKQIKSFEKSKLQRFVVKKSDLVGKISTNNSSTNLSARKKPIKLRFTVLKSKASKDSQPEIPNRTKTKNQTGTKSKMNLEEKSIKTIRNKNSEILSTIRQDVLNLANELHHNYVTHSKSILATSEDVNNLTNGKQNQKTNKKDYLLEEIKRRLQYQPKFKNKETLIDNDRRPSKIDSTNLDTLNGMKSINSRKVDSSSCQYDATLSMISTNTPLNSSFITASDNSVTSYKSIASSIDNTSPCLNSLDLRDIHFISDEIHELAQKKLTKPV